MSWWATIRNCWKWLCHGKGHDVNELSRRLGIEPALLRLARTDYWWHSVPKRHGGTRVLHSPNPELKQIQRRLLRRLFARLKVHPAAKGFRRGESTVTHARLHVNRAVVIRIDIRNFFPATKWQRLYDYLRKIGWDRTATWLILRLTTHRRRLPQGAPTSPILSNLVNYHMDVRLTALAKKSNAIYSRYADDIIFSFEQDDRRFIRGVIRRIRTILYHNGYRMNAPKQKWMRRHQPQTITGLVVNTQVQLPRRTRKWLRAVEHHLKTGRPATLTPAQLAGWKAWQHAVHMQGSQGDPQ